MSQHLDRAKTGTCAKRPLSLVVRFGGLLVAGVLLSTFGPDLQKSLAGRDAASPLAQPYVPAADRWISLGTSPQPQPAPAVSPPADADAVPIAAATTRRAKKERAAERRTPQKSDRTHWAGSRPERRA